MGKITKTSEITELGLSTRAVNCLYRSRGRTIEGLCSLTPLEILRLKNAGPKTLNEIRTTLAYYGLSLTDDKGWHGHLSPARKKIIEIAESFIIAIDENRSRSFLRELAEEWIKNAEKNA